MAKLPTTAPSTCETSSTKSHLPTADVCPLVSLSANQRVPSPKSLAWAGPYARGRTRWTPTSMQPEPATHRTEAISGHYRNRQTHRQRLPQPHQLPAPNAPHHRRPRYLHPHPTLKSHLTFSIQMPERRHARTSTTVRLPNTSPSTERRTYWFHTVVCQLACAPLPFSTCSRTSVTQASSIVNAKSTYGRKPEPLFDGCLLSSPLHHGIQARYPSDGGVGESGSKPSSSGVSGMRSTRKYLSLSSQCSRTMVRNSASSQYRTPVIGFLLYTTILYSQ